MGGICKAVKFFGYSVLTLVAARQVSNEVLVIFVLRRMRDGSVLEVARLDLVTGGEGRLFAAKLGLRGEVRREAQLHILLLNELAHGLCVFASQVVVQAHLVSTPTIAHGVGPVSYALAVDRTRCVHAIQVVLHFG